MAKAAKKKKPETLMRKARRDLGMTLYEVAKQADVTAGFVSKVERGISGVSPEQAQVFAAVLQMNAADVIFARVSQ